MKSQLVTLPAKKYHVPVYTVAWLKDPSLYRDLYAQYAREEIERTWLAEEDAEAGAIDDAGFDWTSGTQRQE